MTPTATPVTYGQDASIYRFSVDRYQRMVEAGILTPEDKVELLENYVVLKMPRNPPHDGTIDLLKAALPGRIPPPDGCCGFSKPSSWPTASRSQTSPSSAAAREPPLRATPWPPTSGS